MKVSVETNRKSRNKVKGDRGKFRSTLTSNSVIESGDGKTVSTLKQKNKVRGNKGKYKSKGTKLTRRKDGSCTLSVNRVRGEKGRSNSRIISKSACDRRMKKMK